MRTISIAVGSTPRGRRINLGRRGENGAMALLFDMTALAEVYGSGTAVLLAKRSQDTEAYPAVITQEGNTVTWVLTEADTAYHGEGEAELLYYVGDLLAKSIVYPTVVERDIGAAVDTPPGTYDTWLDTLTELEAQTRRNAAAAGIAQTAAETAQAEAEAAADSIAELTATAETLAAGSSATVMRTTVGGKVNLHFGIPRGADGTMIFEDLTEEQKAGLKGEKGDTGATGPQGPQGHPGEKGEKGDTGAGVPAVTSVDNGKVLGVVDGAWAAVDIGSIVPSAAGEMLSAVTLFNAWSGSGPYTQTVLIADSTANSLVSLQPTTAQIDQLRTDGVTMLRVDNDGGVFTATAIGAAPTTEMTIQCMVTETEATA